MCACGADKRPGFLPCCESLKKLHPIGITPEYIWIEHRIQALSEAIIRFAEAGLEIPDEWYEERNKHINWLKWRNVNKKDNTDVNGQLRKIKIETVTRKEYL